MIGNVELRHWMKIMSNIKTARGARTLKSVFSHLEYSAEGPPKGASQPDNRVAPRGPGSSTRNANAGRATGSTGDGGSGTERRAVDDRGHDDDDDDEEDTGLGEENNAALMMREYETGAEQSGRRASPPRAQAALTRMHCHMACTACTAAHSLTGSIVCSPFAKGVWRGGQ